MSTSQPEAESLPLPKCAAVSGASGFIGAHLVQHLLDQGVAVSALILPGDAAPALAPFELRRVHGNIASGDGLDEWMKGCDAVFHLAAVYALWSPEPAKIHRVNVGGTQNVMRAARAAGIRRVVHTSSIAAVRSRPGRLQANEETRFDEWEIADDYVRSKYVSELAALAERDADLEVVVVNPAFPLGPGDLAPTPTGRVVRDMATGRLPVLIDGGLNVVDVRDAARAHLLAWQRGRSGRRYILAGHDVTHRDLALAVASAAGRRPPRLRVPAAAMIAAGRLSERLADRVTHRNPMMTERAVRYTVGRYLWFDGSRSRQELGMTVRPLEQTVHAAVRWFLSASDSANLP